MSTLLITGFEPFGGESVNPSSLAAVEAARTLASKLPGVSVVSAVLPVSYRRAREAVRDLVEKHKPDVAIALGQAGGLAYVAVERVAVNLMDTGSPDNDGYAPVDEPIEPGAPAAYFSTLPVRLIVKKLREAGIPAALSYSAGTFICNLVMFELLHLSATRGWPRRAGFLHLPYLPEQAAGKR
ncbi:MAG: pyroglutamyl-peptidase I, partial [Thermofilum sp.]